MGGAEFYANVMIWGLGLVFVWFGATEYGGIVKFIFGAVVVVVFINSVFLNILGAFVIKGYGYSFEDVAAWRLYIISWAVQISFLLSFIHIRNVNLFGRSR